MQKKSVTRRRSMSTIFNFRLGKKAISATLLMYVGTVISAIFTSTLAFAQVFTPPPAPNCAADAQPNCAIHANVVTKCGTAKSPDEFAKCANGVISTSAASETDRIKNQAKSSRSDLKTGATSAAVSTGRFLPPPTPQCPKAGVPGRVECELAKRAFAACSKSSTNADFSQCVRGFVSTKPLNCEMAATNDERDECVKVNKSKKK